MRVLSSLWTAIAPALGDHLWQSTMAALVAGLLTLLLRKNHARARYWLWLAASLKFLVPCSWLVALGSWLAWRPAATGAGTALYFTIEEVSQPFTQSSIIAPAGTSVVSSGGLDMLWSILTTVWLCGVLAVLWMWYMRWRRISGEIDQAVPLTAGREVECLRRLECHVGIATRIKIRLSQSTLEPGIFGLTRPVLVWPEGMSEHLDDAQLEAVIAHELWHVRRRDNLAAALHMIVEAIFWFHPLVWWLGARLLDERERACDEEVLESGREPQIYAESILKVCEFCVGSPLPCVSGVTGAVLKKRMVHIMSQHVVRKLDFTRRLLLSAVAVAAIVAPIVFGVFHATPTRAQSEEDNAISTENVVQSATIKPSKLNTPTYAGTKTHMIRMMFGAGGFDAANVTLRALMQEAYEVQASQIVGGPDWFDSAAFDAQVKLRQPETNAPPSKQQMEQLRHVLQTLLADRVKLVFHTQTQNLLTYSLIVAENGPKLQPAPSGESDDIKASGPVRIGRQEMRMQIGGDQVYGIGAQGVSANDFAQQLSRQLGTPVVNKTGLKGRYDFNLHWSDGNTGSSESEASSSNVGEPSLFTALQEQLGLKLKSEKALMQVLVIDRIEKPTEN